MDSNFKSVLFQTPASYEIWKRTFLINETDSPKRKRPQFYIPYRTLKGPCKNFMARNDISPLTSLDLLNISIKYQPVQFNVLRCFLLWILVRVIHKDFFFINGQIPRQISLKYGLL